MKFISTTDYADDTADTCHVERSRDISEFDL